MSLHAQLSPEAQAALAAQKRNSTISAIIIALLVFVLLMTVLFYIFINPLSKETSEIITFNPNSTPDDKIEKPEVQNQVERRPSAPSASMSKVIAASTSSPTTIAVPDIQVTEPQLDFGSGDDFGSGWGSGDGNDAGGGDFGNIPTSMKKRCSKADRLERLSKEGGTPECEDAVVNALRWMQKTQNKDGSWTNSEPVAMTGLALLAYLGHCETPNSSEFGQTVSSAIVYLVGIGMKNNGSLSKDLNSKDWPYEHAIATYALAEAYTFCSNQNINIPNLKEAVQMAGNHILNSQHKKTGGWDYSYDMTGKRGGDSSIVCWHLQALKACNHTNLKFRDMSSIVRNALEFLESCQQNNGGVYYYPGDEHLPSMTGGLMLCHQQWGKSARATVRNAAKFASNVQFEYNTANADLYAHYYYGQAMINRKGKEWRDYNNKFRDELLKNQAADGSWLKAPGGGQKLNANAADSLIATEYSLHYRTCLCTLMLEVYYRFLPGTSTQE